jgi:hypothetical protein
MGRAAALAIVLASCSSAPVEEDAGGLDAPVAPGLDAPIAPGIDAPPGDSGPPGAGRSLRFFGQGGTYDDRVRIRLDDPATTSPGPRVDVGATDLTIEFWMRADAADNPNTIGCGDGIGWTGSNIVVDRDRHSQSPTFGVGIQSSAIVWHVTGEAGDAFSMCGSATVADGAWHHVAVQRRRSDGELSIWIDGALDVRMDGPDGDVSYPDDGVPQNVCPGGLCDYSDPFLVLGAEKHGYGGISYRGLLDELRISTTLRYASAFAPPTAPFAPDAETAALYHFDEGAGTTAADATGPGGTDGELRVGGDPVGPQWSSETPF